ncbi:hypothetical protein D9M68_789590 [compost metagenome]
MVKLPEVLSAVLPGLLPSASASSSTSAPPSAVTMFSVGSESGATVITRSASLLSRSPSVMT